MKDLIITIDYESRKVKFNRDFIGMSGENLQGNIVVDFIDKADFIDGLAAFEVEQHGGKYFLAMTKDATNKTYTLPIKSSLLAYVCQMKCQVTITQAETTDGVPVFKTEIFTLPCRESVNAKETIPEQYPLWVDKVNARLEALEENPIAIAQTTGAATDKVMSQKAVTDTVSTALGSVETALEELAARIPDEQEKTVTITENGAFEITPEPNKTISKVSGTVNVQPNLQQKTVTPSESQQVVQSDSSHDGLSQVTVEAIQTETETVTPTKSAQTKTPTSGKYYKSVTVEPIPDDYIIPSGTLQITSNGTYDVSGKANAMVNVEQALQAKSVTPSKTQQIITADSPNYGLSQVTVYAAPTETATVTPTKSTQTKTPSSGKVGFSQVTINPIPDDYIIPSGSQNITENGTYDVSGKANAVVNVESGAELNIVYSQTAPTDTSKLWIKANEPEKISFSSNAENQLYQYVDLPIVLPIKVKACPVTAVGSKIYIFGSLDDYENNICVVDLSDNTVTTITKAFGYSMKDSKAVTVGDKIYIFCAPAAKILMYDPQTDTLTEKLDWVCGASVYMGCAVYNDCIYIAGKDSAYNSNRGDMYLYCYNTISNSVSSLGWITGQNYRYASVAVYGDHLYVVGGQRQSSSFDTTKSVMKYDFEAKTWTELSNVLPATRYQLKNLRVGAKLYLFGALYYAETVYCFDFETETCELIGQQFPNHNDYENVWYANAFYRVGGSTTESVQKSVSKFTVDFALPQGNVLLYESGGGVPIKILSGNSEVEVKIKNVFIGNASGRAILLDAYYHNGTNWVNINTKATFGS